MLPLLCLTMACGGSNAPIVIGSAGPWEEHYALTVKQGIEMALATQFVVVPSPGTTP